MTLAAADTRGTFVRWAMVGILLAFYILSFIDRLIISMMVGPIEHDLVITDFQMSLLTGPAFGLFYVFAGLVTGTLVDRYPRRLIAGIGIAVWGLATSFCGVAGGYAWLALGRVGVGVGESTLTPAAHAMIAESFPRRLLTTAIAIFTTGGVIGSGIALAVGGIIVHIVTNYQHIVLPLVGAVRPWQAVFLLIGLITLIATPLIFLVPEPPRSARTSPDTPAGAITFGQLLRERWGLYIALPVGFGCTNILVQAYNFWVPTFLIRTYGLDTRQAGLAIGLLCLVAGLSGQVSAALITDRLYARGMGDAHVKFQLWAMCAAFPLVILAFLSSNVWLFLILGFVFFAFCWTFVGCAGAALQLYAPSHLRGRISALFLALISAIGLLVGPPAVGWFTDHLFHDKALIGRSLILLTVLTAPFITVLLLRAAREMRAMYAEHLGAPESTYVETKATH